VSAHFNLPDVSLITPAAGSIPKGLGVSASGIRINVPRVPIAPIEAADIGNEMLGGKPTTATATNLPRTFGGGVSVRSMPAQATRMAELTVASKREHLLIGGSPNTLDEFSRPSNTGSYG